MMLEFPHFFFQHPTLLVVRELRDQETLIKVFLASIIRRAAFDIALYKNSRKLVDRRLAVQAKQWMFDDRNVMNQHPMDRFTSFLNLCDMLDQDPKWIRERTMALRACDVRKFDRVGSV